MPSAEAISELLLRWDELREQGREVSAEELCRDCPELTDEARRRINVLKAMYRVPNAPPTGDVLPRWATPPLPVTTPAGPSASAGLSAQIEVPGYEILQPLGSGGMGRVF